METKSLKHFLERGYLTFPYFIVRMAPTVYVQIPLHDEALSRHYPDGIFLLKEDEDHCGYEAACLLALFSTWRFFNERGRPRDLCLVLNGDQGYYLSKEWSANKVCEPKLGTIPEGGMLYTPQEELIRINEPHFVTW